MKPAVSTSPLFFLVVSLSLFHTFSTATKTTNPTTNPTNNKTTTTKNTTTTTNNNTNTLHNPADIQKACSIAKDKSFCLQALQSNPKSRGLNLKDLSFLAMTMAQDNGTATLKFVSQKLGDENELPAGLDESLGDCEDLYEDAGVMLENAMSAFFTKGKDEVTKWLSAAMADAMSCEDGLKTSGTKAAMANRNQVFYKLVSNAWSVYDAAVADSKH